MRTIKIRALKDDISNCIFYYGSLIYDKKGNPRIYDIDTDLFHTCIKGTEEQFTGLKDKNCKEIYEGDMFMLPRVKAKDEYLGTVNFDDDLGCFVVNESNGGWSLLYNFMTDNKTAFIGGNIYENKELLK